MPTTDRPTDAKRRIVSRPARPTAQNSAKPCTLIIPGCSQERVLKRQGEGCTCEGATETEGVQTRTPSAEAGGAVYVVCRVLVTRARVRRECEGLCERERGSGSRTRLETSERVTLCAFSARLCSCETSMRCCDRATGCPGSRVARTSRSDLRSVFDASVRSKKRGVVKVGNESRPTSVNQALVVLLVSGRRVLGLDKVHGRGAL